MALIGGEVLQFVSAERVEGARWRLSGLLRGRGGTEPAAAQGASAGAAFVLLDEAPVALDATKLGEADGATIAAIGLADPEPVYVPLASPGLTRRPLTPVHGRAAENADAPPRLGPLDLHPGELRIVHRQLERPVVHRHPERAQPRGTPGLHVGLGRGPVHARDPYQLAQLLDDPPVVDRRQNGLLSFEIHST